MKDEIPKIRVRSLTPKEESNTRRAVQKLIDRWDGKICPRTPRVGRCAYCPGKVTEEFERRWEGSGTRGHHYWESSGLFCEDCGIAYRKLPKSTTI